MKPLIIPFFIPHAGCPHDCVFCNQRLIAGAGAGLPQADQIESTVRQWLQRSPDRPAEVAFFGGSFTLLPLEQQQMLLGAVHPLIDQRLLSGIRISTRPDGIDPDILSFLSVYRVRTIEIGVQSLDDQVLQRAGRGHMAEQSLTAIRLCRKAGFLTGAQLMPGLPGDTPEKSMAALDGVIAAGAQFTRIYPAIVLKNTAMADLYQRGDWQPVALDDTIKTCARMYNRSQKAGLPVIRLGLQSDEGLVPGDTILAGPWHPAFGQLVRGELYHALVCKLVASLPEALLRICCHPMRLSDVSGHKRRNLDRWQQLGIAIDRVDIHPSLRREEIMVQTLNHNLQGSILTDLNDKEILDA